MATTEMKRLKEENTSLKKEIASLKKASEIDGNYADAYEIFRKFLLRKDETLDNFQAQFNAMNGAKSNARFAYECVAKGFVTSKAANDAFDEYVGRRNQLDADLEEELYDSDIHRWKVCHFLGNEDNRLASEFTKVMTFLETVKSSSDMSVQRRDLSVITYRGNA